MAFQVLANSIWRTILSAVKRYDFLFLNISGDVRRCFDSANTKLFRKNKNAHCPLTGSRYKIHCAWNFIDAQDYEIVRLRLLLVQTLASKYLNSALGTS